MLHGDALDDSRDASYGGCAVAGGLLIAYLTLLVVKGFGFEGHLLHHSYRHLC